MIGDGVAYVYNAVEADQRAFVTKVQELREAHGDMAFHCVDIYKSEGMAKRLGVEEYPAFVVIKDGKIAEKVVGSFDKAAIEEKIAA